LRRDWRQAGSFARTAATEYLDDSTVLNDFPASLRAEPCAQVMDDQVTGSVTTLPGASRRRR
jgi:hypothetical protein